MVEAEGSPTTWKFTQYVPFGLYALQPQALHRESRRDNRAPSLRRVKTTAVELANQVRCFGDKGDVEDITEGETHFAFSCVVSFWSL